MNLSDLRKLEEGDKVKFKGTSFLNFTIGKFYEVYIHKFLGPCVIDDLGLGRTLDNSIEINNCFIGEKKGGE